MEQQKRIRHALVNSENKVVNVVVWNGHPWIPPVGHMVVQDDKVNIGDIYDPITHTFTRPKQEEQPLPLEGE